MCDNKLSRIKKHSTQHAPTSVNDATLAHSVPGLELRRDAHKWLGAVGASWYERLQKIPGPPPFLSFSHIKEARERARSGRPRKGPPNTVRIQILSEYVISEAQGALQM